MHEWQKQFCQENHCAAFLLSFFSAWHDWKLKNDVFYQRVNDITEAHGDGRPHNENAYLFFTMEDFTDALMGLFGKKSISDALDLLVSLQVISVHKNPNPRYCFDKTKYFKFYPGVCNQWLQNKYSTDKSLQNDTQVIDNFHNAKMDDRSRKNGQPSSENGRPSRKNGQAITNNTNNTTNKNKLINAADDFPELEKIIDVLMKQGMPADRLKVGNDLELLAGLVKQGATVSMIIQAYDLSVKATALRGNHFGVRYLAKVIADLLQKKGSVITSNTNRIEHDETEPAYKNDFSGGMSWMGDLVE